MADNPYAKYVNPYAGYVPVGVPDPMKPLDITGKSISNTKDSATLPYDIEKAKNEAAKSGIDVKTAQTDLAAKTGTPPGDLSKYGDAYLATLPPGVGDLTKELLSGNYKGSITSSRNPVVMQAALAASHATHGNFDAGRYDERLALMKGITNPNSQLGALNTAIAHAGMLYDQAPKVAGTKALGDNVLSTGANALYNWFHSGSPAVTQYQSILQKYGPESARAYGVNTGGEREQAQAPLSINLPLDAKQAALKTDMELFAGKIASLAHQNDILGGNHPIDYLSPEAKDALQKIDPEGYDKFVAATSGGNRVISAIGGKALPTPITVPVNASDAEIRAAARAHGYNVPDSSPVANSLKAAPRTYADSYLGQALSGANEGLAGVLGAPADLARAAINLVPEGINALANTNIPTLPQPIGGSESIKGLLSRIGSIQPPSADAAKQFVRRVSEDVGAAAVPGMFGGTLPKFGQALLSGLTGGLGAATAQQVAPNNPLAEIAGDMAGTLAGGYGIARAGQRAAQRGIENAVPTVDELKQQAANLYNRAETRGVTASPEQTQALADQFRKTLVDEGQLGPNGAITNADTNTNKAYNLLQQYAGKEMTPKQMNTVRTVLADSRQSADPADRRLGNILLDQFDNFVSPLAPEFNQARSVASRYLQAQDLEKARELAGARASQFTGSGFENALRTEYRGLDRNSIKGNNYFSPDVTAAIQTVARGTPASNFARGLGKLAPTGVVPMMGDVLPAMAVGSAVNPAAGGMFGAGLAGLGIGGRVAATRMGINAADKAELIARNGGQLAQAPLLPDDVRKFLAQLAAIQQAKYLSGGNSPQ